MSPLSKILLWLAAGMLSLSAVGLVIFAGQVALLPLLLVVGALACAGAGLKK